MSGFGNTIKILDKVRLDLNSSEWLSPVKFEEKIEILHSVTVA